MKKALKISIIALFVSLAIFSVISYILWKEKTTYIFECIIDFINRPLPIVGVSLVIIGAFVFKCFIASKYGKKALREYESSLEECKKELSDKEKEIDDTLKGFENDLQLVIKKNDEVKETLIKSLEMSKNIKLKALAMKLKGETYGEEETNCDQEEETL